MIVTSQWLAVAICLIGIVVRFESTQVEKQPAKVAITLTAEVDGFTQPTEFNKTKYPFKYTGTSALDADQLSSLAKAGDVPPATAKALCTCLLWPEMEDKLESAALKSDGKKLTGEVEVLHNYGKQGTHTIKLMLDGTIDNGRLTLKAVNPTVTGTWNSGRFTVKLAGETKIAITAK